MAVESMKDTVSINEMESLSRLLQAVNEFVVEWEVDDSIEITELVVNVRSKDNSVTNQTLGAITMYSTKEDVKFEPGLVAELT